MDNESLEKISFRQESQPASNPDPTKSPESQQVDQRKKMTISAVYGLLSIIVAILIITIINTYVLHLKVSTAVVSAPIETMSAPSAGMLAESFVTQGQTVKKGEPLFKVDDIQLQQNLELARIQAQETKFELAHQENLLVNEQQRLGIYKTIGTNRQDSAQGKVEKLKQEVIVAKKNLERFTELRQKNVVSQANLEEATVKYSDANRDLQSAIADLGVETASLNAVDKGSFFTGNKLEGIVTDLKANIDATRNKLILDNEKVGVYENTYKKLTLTAPFDCRVIRVTKTVGNSIEKGEPVLLLERLVNDATIIAYLTQSEVTGVALGDKAKIYIPGTGKSYKAHVVNIDDNAGMVYGEKGFIYGGRTEYQYHWRNDDDRIVQVTLSIVEDLPSGTPAVVYFPRKFSIF